MHAEPEEARCWWEDDPAKLREVNAVISSTFDLLNDQITGPDWLQGVADLFECQSVMCPWWPVSRPNNFLAESAGPQIDMPHNWTSVVEQLVVRAAPGRPVFVDELAEQDPLFVENPADPLFRPHRIVGCLIAGQAIVLMVLQRDENERPWDDYDRSLLNHVFPAFRKSIRTKGNLSALKDNMDLANKVFDTYARAIITTSLDGGVMAANLMARDFSANGAAILLNDDQLRFRDIEVQREFEAQLVRVDHWPADRLAEFAWYKRLTTNGSDATMLLTMRIIEFDNWRRESSSFSRGVVLVISQSDVHFLPGELRLREFYQLTRAQARLANELLRTGNIEETAQALNISTHTARSHLRNIYGKLGVDNKAQMIRLLSQTFTANVNRTIK